jgi:hypothetical protein
MTFKCTGPTKKTKQKQLESQQSGAWPPGGRQKGVGLTKILGYSQVGQLISVGLTKVLGKLPGSLKVRGGGYRDLKKLPWGQQSGVVFTEILGSYQEASQVVGAYKDLRKQPGGQQSGVGFTEILGSYWEASKVVWCSLRS